MDFATDSNPHAWRQNFDGCQHPLPDSEIIGAGSRLIIIVTGGLGFIGKHFVRRCLELRHWITNIDVVNYAADRVAQKEFVAHPNYRFIQQDIAELNYLPECDLLVNFAAESHVDNSITNNAQFTHSNIIGVQKLLELTRMKQPGDRPRFIQISTDEVYGDIEDGAHTEGATLRPSNPYSATKAAADMLIKSWARTYSIDSNIIRPTNNYGPHQYPEKLIPKSCGRLARGRPAILHGDGSYQRCWLHVEDTVDAILTVMAKGKPNTIYNVSGDLHISNINILRKLAAVFDVPEDAAWDFVEDRLGQDKRYSLDDTRLRALGWAPSRVLDDELQSIARTFDFKRFL